MHKSDPVCVVSPPEGSPGADGVLADFIRTRKPLLLLATDPTHPIGGEWRQPRPQLRGGAADSRPDPAADHTPGWDSLSLCVCVLMVFLLCESNLLPDSRLCVLSSSVRFFSSSQRQWDDHSEHRSSADLRDPAGENNSLFHVVPLFHSVVTSCWFRGRVNGIFKTLTEVCFVVQIVIWGYSVWNEFSVISCKCFALIAAGLFPLHRHFKMEIIVHLRRFVLTWKVTTQVQVVLKSKRFVCI